MFVWEKGGVQSPPYLQHLTRMAPEQLSLVHSKGMRLNWARPAKAKHCMAEAKRATPSLGYGEQDRNQNAPHLTLPHQENPQTLLPNSLCYDSWAFLMPHCQRNTQLFLEQMIFLGFSKKYNFLFLDLTKKKKNNNKLETIETSSDGSYCIFFFFFC